MSHVSMLNFSGLFSVNVVTPVALSSVRIKMQPSLRSQPDDDIRVNTFD